MAVAIVIDDGIAPLARRPRIRLHAFAPRFGLVDPPAELLARVRRAIGHTGDERPRAFVRLHFRKPLAADDDLAQPRVTIGV
jgi:hypothetical protein